MPEQQPVEWATIGKIVAPFGVRGEVKVRSLSDVPGRFVTLKDIYLGSQHVHYTVVAARPARNEVYILKFSGIDDIDTAETLRNHDLSIPLDQLAELPPDSYYQHDILGLRVITLQGHELGLIVDIIVTGSNDVYVIDAPSGKQILIPAIKQIVKQVDLARKVMYIEPINGMIDEDAVIDYPDTNLEREEEQEE
ncbi:MAG TPA: ribosome maturation factor RimM [Ktedonobacteraceae bacterium]